MIEAGMYFKFGQKARPDIKSKGTFEAIENGERTSTTRFPEDSPAQFKKFQRLRPGDQIRFWEGRWKNGSFQGRSLTVTVKGTLPINISTMSHEDKETWSRAEGWRPQVLEEFKARGRSSGLQILYELHEPPEETQKTLL